MPRRRKIIIDTDPGQDDAVAILLALGKPRARGSGHYRRCGNVPLAADREERPQDLRAGRPAGDPGFRRRDRPLVRELVTAEEVHGKTGLNGPELPEPTMPLQSEHAVDFIVGTLMREASGAVTLCALGPLTNLALALIARARTSPRASARSS